MWSSLFNYANFVLDPKLNVSNTVVTCFYDIASVAILSLPVGKETPYTYIVLFFVAVSVVLFVCMSVAFRVYFSDIIYGKSFTLKKVRNADVKFS